MFRQFEAEGRLLHRDWSRYDTAHVVFQPKHMTAEQLQDGYAASYRRLFSHASIWRRRPEARERGRGRRRYRVECGERWRVGRRLRQENPFTAVAKGSVVVES